MSASSERTAKGTNLVDLVRFLRARRKHQQMPSAPPAAEALLHQRILLTQWYPMPAFVELVEYTWQHVLACDEQAAYDMGASGGRTQLQGAHRALLHPGDAPRTVLAMRHTWRLNFNFGALEAASDGDAIVFTLSGYEDATPAHGFMTAGWAAGAAQMAGAPHARAQVLKCPWHGGHALVYRVTFG